MFVDSLHDNLDFKKGEYFLKLDKQCLKIGRVTEGVLRGYIIDNEGNEVTTHFYQEGDMLLGNYIPNVNSSINIQTLTPCIVSTANYSEVMSHVNKNTEITQIINTAFLKLNSQLQSRLVSLLNLDSLEKYKLFLKEYPNLINRIPHYYIANFLGITPTQLSRARKGFSQQM
jgi:CRP-like cAMP-binding protein